MCRVTEVEMSPGGGVCAWAGRRAAYTSVEFFGLFLPRLCARLEAPTGARGALGLMLMALKVAFMAPCTHTQRGYTDVILYTHVVMYTS